MRRWLARAAMMGLAAACAPADPAARAELAWRTCESAENSPYRIDACTRIIEDPGTGVERRAAAYMHRGAQRAELGQYARAIADLGRASRLAPSDPQIFVERGIVHQARGAYADALRAFDVALSLEPELSAALDHRAEVLAAQRQTDLQTVERVTEALLRDPRNAELLNERCWLRAIHDEPLDLALADCNAALSIDPKFAAALDSRGLVNLKRGAFAAALTDYQAAVDLEPGNGHFLYGRGLARIGVGDKPGGQADLAAAESAMPGVALLYQSYGVSISGGPTAAPSP